jgi:hypothetical protein
LAGHDVLLHTDEHGRVSFHPPTSAVVTPLPERGNG